MSVYKGDSMKLSFAAFMLLFFMTGCGGGGGGGGDSGSGANGGSSAPPDSTAPSVTAMSPGEDTGGSSGVPGIGTNSKLTATLSEAMIPADVNTDYFRLTDGRVEADGVTLIYLPGTVSYDATNHIAVFTPSGGLAPNTRYTATVVTGIKDLGNNPLMNDFAWCFTADAVADNAAPGVASTIPTGNDTGVAVNHKISATFSEEMNSSMLTATSFTVKGPGTTTVPGTVTYINRTASFTPSNNLASNTPYTATITADATDLAGNASRSMAWSFTTGANPDVAAPVINSTSPTDGATGVAIGTTFNVSFNEPMDPASITTANFLVTGPGTDPVTGTVAFDASSNTAIFTRINHLTTPVDSHPTPVSNLEPGTIYTARLTTGAKDMAGNALANDKVWSFTTAP
ncbi:hypothetical protein SCL_1765 [Sulfuricaulis limicola]|uniref:SbsA Ig-like domain-containing protein n=1 Tax=Sulfuricaulis limicola TaxID=1620215 RepID=A0A1B4XH02_9GAMM|nr:Ig-like domain-containing protein [Sulfuricaulis limicola]BAV34063.1 hypothetical protein SCL_1765 [Sulfuricaulis limicola]